MDVCKFVLIERHRSGSAPLVNVCVDSFMKSVHRPEQGNQHLQVDQQHCPVIIEHRIACRAGSFTAASAYHNRIGGLVIKFGVVENALSGDNADRLADQMISLKLNDRYRSEVNTYITGHAVTLHLHHTGGRSDRVRNFLNLQARYERQALYRNHWQPILFSALAAHNEFVDGGFTLVLPIPVAMLEDLLERG